MSSEKWSWPAGTAVWVVNTVFARHGFESAREVHALFDQVAHALPG